MSHLGGHMGITHTDAAVLRLLQHRFGVRTMLDVGCGPGGMRHVADALGIAWAGIDGDPSVAQPGVATHDYTRGALVWPTRVDLVWSVEFVEHVEARYQPHYLATFRAGHVLFLTHALPGQIGHHHVECHPADYWIALLTADGWRHERGLSAMARARARDIYTQATGTIFTREA